MDMDPLISFLLNFFFNVILKLLKIWLKILYYTGILFAIGLRMLVHDFLRPRLYPEFTRINHPVAYDRYMAVLAVVCIAVGIVTLFFNVRRTFQRWGLFTGSGKPNHGKEVRAALSNGQPVGFVFGKARKWICKPESLDGHILVLGGAGSGKSSCIAIPSLLSWGQRVFAIDIKGELSEKTGRNRPSLQVFNPQNPASPGYNPYYLLKTSRNPVQDAREIAQSIVPKPANTREPFWIDNAQNLFTGAILHFYEQGYSFIDTIYAIQSTPVSQLVQEIHGSDSMDARLFVNQLVEMDTKTLGGIYAELSGKIMVFATDPDIKASLSRSATISPEDLESGSDIYLHIPEDKLEQWKGLLTLIVNQFLKHFERRPDATATPVLFLLDEFPRLGRVETAVNGLATLRSKKVTIGLFAQSLAQLDAIYGRENRQVIADNCQYKAILSATDADTQDYFSRLVGTYDKKKKSSGAQFEQYSGLEKGTSTSQTTEEKRIIKPEEFAALKDVVLLTPYGFARVGKTPYYKTKIFS